jgi:hypothetical protein
MLQGGWESWAQVECALALGHFFQPDGILREQAIYQHTTDRIDLWVNDNNHVPAGIEMKCRNVNFGGWEAQNGLPGQMCDDIAKIGSPLEPEFPAKVMYAIGITNNPYDLVWSFRIAQNAVTQSIWGQRGPNHNNRLRWCYLRQYYTVENNLKNQQNSENLYLIWYKLS